MRRWMLSVNAAIPAVVTLGGSASAMPVYILDVAVAQSEAEIEPDGLLDDDARKAVAVV